MSNERYTERERWFAKKYNLPLKSARSLRLDRRLPELSRRVQDARQARPGPPAAPGRHRSTDRLCRGGAPV